MSINLAMVKMENFLEKHKLPKVTQYEIVKLSGTRYII